MSTIVMAGNKKWSAIHPNYLKDSWMMADHFCAPYAASTK